MATTAPPTADRSIDTPVRACHCDQGIDFTPECCGQLVSQRQGPPRCCMNNEWVARECLTCGGTGYRIEQDEAA